MLSFLPLWEYRAIHDSIRIIAMYHVSVFFASIRTMLSVCLSIYLSVCLSVTSTNIFF